MKKDICDECLHEYGNVVPDLISPSAEIRVDGNSWQIFTGEVTFEIFFNDSQCVTVSAFDDETGINGAEYFVSETVYTDKKSILDDKSINWIQLNLDSNGIGQFDLELNKKLVVYLKVVDNAGNVTVIRSNGIVLDKESPVLSGIVNGGIYCDSVEVTVSDTYLDTVTLNGSELVLDNGKFTVSPALGAQKIVAIDKAGNVTMYEITVNDGHIYTYEQSTTDTIIEDCLHCDYSASAQIVAPSGQLIYDGSAHDANIIYNGILSCENNLSISYGGATNTINAGFYTATITLGNKNASISYTIEKATPNIGTVSVIDPNVIYFDTELNDIVFSRSDSSIDGVLTLDMGQSLITGTNDYNWIFTPVDTENYNLLTGKISLTVSKKQLDVSNVAWDIVGTSFIYDGTVKYVDIVGLLPDGVVIIKSGYSATDAGNYTAVATFELADGYSDTNYEIVGAVNSQLIVDWTIAPKIVSAEIVVSPDSYTYTGNAIEPTSIAVKYGDAVIPTNEYSVVITNNTNAGTATVTVTDNSGGNYIVNGIASFTIVKADPIAIWPENLSGKQGDTLSSVILPDGFSWDDTEELIKYGESTYAMIFTPVDTINYNIIKTDVKLIGLDVTAPTAEIILGTNSWNSFLNNITFGLFFKETQTININANDTESGIREIAFYLSNVELSAEDVRNISQDEWVMYDNNLTVDPSNQYVIYVRIIDNAGNISYVNSDGLVLDNVLPVVFGIENEADVYGDATFTVNEEFLDTVNVDGNVIDCVDGKYTITADNEAHSIVVTDKSGNAIEYTIKVYKNYTVAFVIDGIEVSKQVVGHGKDAELPVIPQKEGYIASWDSDGKNISKDSVITAIYTLNPIDDTSEEVTSETDIPEFDTSETDTPTTGDDNLSLWFILLILSGIVIVGTIVFSSKKRVN